MNARTRRAVVFIVSRLTGGQATSVYDFDAGAHFHFSGDVSAKECRAFDHGEGAHITGTPPSLYHHGNAKHLTVEVEGDAFSGYDYDSGKHFSGKVSGKTISLYDYDGGGYHNYAV